MTAYFDTSALVPLVIDEPGSDTCTRAWHAADAVSTSSLAYVETHTALAQALRLGRLTEQQLAQARASFEQIWAQIATISPSDGLIREAATLGAEHALRGYDAVHCASALASISERGFTVSGDRALLEAWHALGVVTVDANQAGADPRLA